MWASLRKGSDDDMATRSGTSLRSSLRDLRGGGGDEDASAGTGASAAAVPTASVPVYRPGGVYGDEEGAGDAQWKPFVVTQRGKFKEWAHLDSHVDMIGQQETLRGYRVYVVAQWMHSLARPQCTLVHHTGDVKDTICVSIVKPDSFTTNKQTDYLTQFFYKPTKSELQARETHLGVLVCATDEFLEAHNIMDVVSGTRSETGAQRNKSPTALSLIPILDGNVDAHLASIELDLTLRKLGCRAEGVPVDLNGPSADVAGVFYRAFPSMRGTPITEAVPALVRQLKVMLDAIGLIMPPAKVDDVYDARLVGSVRSFQRMHNGHQGVRDESVPHVRLPENGLCNADTLNALRARMLLFVGMLFSAGHPFLGDPVLNYDDFKMTVMKFQKTARGLANGKLDNRTVKRLSSTLNSVYCGDYRVRVLDLAGARLSLSGNKTTLHVHAKRGTCTLRGENAQEMDVWHDAMSSTIALLATGGAGNKLASEHVMCGVLKKQSSALFREWSQRFVVLVGAHLVYWYHPIPKAGDGNKKKKKGFRASAIVGGSSAEEAEEGLRCEHDEIGVIALSSSASVCESSRTDDGATLDLFDGELMHLLAFPTVDERNAWVAALNNASVHRKAVRKCGLSLRFCGKIPRWRRRYLVLVDSTLCYFRVEDHMTQLPTSLHSRSLHSPATTPGRVAPASLMSTGGGVLAHRSIVNRLDHTHDISSDDDEDGDGDGDAGGGSGAGAEGVGGGDGHKSRVRFIDADGGVVGTHGSTRSFAASSASSSLSIHVHSDSDSSDSDSDSDSGQSGEETEVAAHAHDAAQVPAEQLTALTEDNEVLRERCAQLEDLVRTQSSEIATLRGECGTLEQALTAHTARQSMLESTVSSLRSTLERMERKDGLQAQRMQALDRRLLESVQAQNALRRRVEKMEEHATAKEASMLSGLAMNASSLALAGAFKVAWAVTSALDMGRHVGHSVSAVLGIDSDSEGESDDSSDGEETEEEEAWADAPEEREGGEEHAVGEHEAWGTPSAEGGDAHAAHHHSQHHQHHHQQQQQGSDGSWFSVPWGRRKRSSSALSAASEASSTGGGGGGGSSSAGGGDVGTITPPRGSGRWSAERRDESDGDADGGERGRASSSASSRASSRATSPTTLHSRFVAASSPPLPPSGGSSSAGSGTSSSASSSSRRSTRRKDTFFSSGGGGLEARLKIKRR